jgi:hypothetical protein
LTFSRHPVSGSTIAVRLREGGSFPCTLGFCGEAIEEVEVDASFTAAARRLGVVSAAGLVLLMVAYMADLALGLMSLRSPQDPIGDPYFTLLELLILAMMPFMVALMVAVHTWAPAELKVFSLSALSFMVALATLTSAVHFSILTLSRHDAFAGQPWLPLLFSFEWPSVVYALDILAWDVFFPLSALFAAPVFGGSRLARWVRSILVLSGVFALAGLAGVVLGDMQVRNIGIVGYTLVFAAAALLLAILFHRAEPRGP